MDSQSKALDDELEAYTKSSEDYIKSLRESIKDTGLVVEQTFSEVLANADIVLSEIDRLAEEYDFTIEPNLRNPWVKAANEATTFKQTAEGLQLLINEGGVISAFGSEETQQKLSGVFGAGSSAASLFEAAVIKHIGAAHKAVDDDKSSLAQSITAPWDEASNNENSGPLAFSKKTKEVMNGIVDYAKTNYQEQLKNNLDYPWDNATAYSAWGNNVTTMLDSKVEEARVAGEKIAEHLNPDTSSYVGSDGSNTDPSRSPDLGYNGKKITSAAVKTLQKFLNQYWNTYVYQATGASQLAVDGSYGSKTKATVKVIQQKLGVRNASGLYDYDTAHAMAAHWQDEKRKMSQYSSSASYYTNAINAIPPAMYAKGTMGTTHNQWAYTDEPWLGDELVLVPTTQGNLSYMRKGTSVVPADITANLVEWGKLNPNMMNISSGTNVNMISNAVTKPNFEFNFDSMVHVDHCDEGTLKDLEKMVDTKINQFSKQMNYAIRKFK